ncbi:hypothetical protein AAHA92_32684 [Salvia divinorum]|uniref:Uncharacterized protein n=1 Tax=Salvia divinorum TaxID=28513 RepID=A0ABD1FLI5_SALDI
MKILPSGAVSTTTVCVVRGRASLGSCRDTPTPASRPTPTLSTPVAAPFNGGAARRACIAAPSLLPHCKCSKLKPSKEVGNSELSV